MSPASKLKKFALALAACLWISAGSALAGGWQDDFDATCAKTANAMELSPKELASLIERCDSLQKVIESQEESVRKVYLKRLQLCRNLYAYVLDYKKKEQPAQ